MPIFKATPSASHRSAGALIILRRYTRKARRSAPPAWLQCELCTRSASSSRRLTTAFVHDEESAPNPESLLLLCADCSALVRGDIGEDEWHRRAAGPQP